MRITTQVRGDVSRALQRRQAPTAASEELARVANELDAVLEPIHPGAEDPSLASYFTLEVPDSVTAEQAISRLQNCEGVEAAYLKPSDETP